MLQMIWYHLLTNVIYTNINCIYNVIQIKYICICKYDSLCVMYATIKGRTYYVHSKNYCFASHFVVLFLLDIWHCYCAYFQARWENYNVLSNDDYCVPCNESKTCNDLFLVFKYALDSNQMCKEWQLLVFVQRNISMIKLIK